MYAPVNKPPLSITHPNLLKEWDYSKNNALGIYPDQITYGSNKKVWWVCKHGHEWQSTVKDRTNKSHPNGCPICAGQKVLVGFNDLATVNPKVALEWHPTKNGDLKPSDVTQGTDRKVWWICKYGHEWQSRIDSRTNKQSGCPVCAGQKVLAGFNDLATVNPQVASEWHPTKNGDLKPSDVTQGTHRKVWWICQHGHEWCASVASRTNKQSGCPVCAGKKVLAGFNDLATVNPNLASEWHPTKNGDLKPTQVTVSSNKKVWWICKHGHEWKSRIADRTNKSQPRGCPVCAGQKVLAGFNDLATVNPNLALEWHPTKNGNLKPSDVTISSGRKVWWICKRGHEWYASVASRTNKSHQSGCPICARLATTSYPESIVSYYMQSLDIKCILQASNVSISQLGNMSVDLYLPAYDLAIEYDGSFYHPEGVERNQRDYKKDAALASSSVNLIRIRDDAKMKKPFTCARLKHYVSYRYSCKNQDYENLQFVIQDIITNQLHLPNKLDFDLVRDNDKINKIKDCMNRSVNVDMCKEV